MTCTAISSGNRAASAVQSGIAGLAIASLSAFYAISYAVVLFDGPLEPLQGHGILVLLASAVIYGLAGAWFSSIPGSWWGNQTVCVAVLALGAQQVAGRADGLAPDVLGATMLAYLTASTLLTGLVFLALGALRLADLVRIIPHPVISGFLAATGLFLAYRSAELVSGATGPAELASPEALLDWLPVIAPTLALVALQRVRPTWRVLFPALFLGVTGFYGYLWLTGMSLSEAKGQDLLLSAPDTLGADGTGLALGSLDLVHWPTLAETVPSIATTAAIAVLALLMNASVVELLTGRPVRLNRDFKNSGLANLVTGALGGVPGFYSASTTHMLMNQFGKATKAQCVAAALYLVALLTGGLFLIGYLPSVIVAVMLAFIGLDILWRWLLTEAGGMSWGDRLIVWLILATSILLGFAAAIGVGLVFSTLLFAVAYSRVGVIRNILNGLQRSSGTERGPSQIAELLQHGLETRIYELQGYLFFGTAERAYALISRDLEAPDVPLRQIVLDFRRVAGIDASSLQMFRKLSGQAREKGVQVIYTDIDRPQLARLEAVGALGEALRFPALPEALTWIEDEILARGSELDARIDPDMRELLDRLDAASGPEGLASRAMGPGETLFGEGDASKSLAIIESGALVASVSQPDGSVRQVARFLPGAVVGEIGLYTGASRTATVTAQQPSVVREIDEALIRDLTRSHPELAAELHLCIARLLGGRLSRTTALVFAIDR